MQHWRYIIFGVENICTGRHGVCTSNAHRLLTRHDWRNRPQDYLLLSTWYILAVQDSTGLFFVSRVYHLAYKIVFSRRLESKVVVCDRHDCRAQSIPHVISLEHTAQSSRASDGDEG